MMLLGDLPEIPPSYLYDDTGSALFERITELPEYYQTRTELGILARCAPDVVAAARPGRIVELGSGAGRKIRLLLDAWRTTGTAGSCTMFDVNECFIDASIRALGADYPEVQFRGVVGDFTRDLARLGAGGERLVVFFGGTVGNLHPDERARFFRELAAQMAASDTLLIGVDLVKDRVRLEAAYNDTAGVTAAFNRRSLHSFNQRFGADFDPEAFAHRAFYDERNIWIEMRLVATRPMVVKVPALDLRLEFARGDEIRTEVSCKFTRASLAAAAAGLAITGWYTDPGELFALASMRKEGPSC
jgi:L-histidine N-alpha-methyltransferase